MFLQHFGLRVFLKDMNMRISVKILISTSAVYIFFLLIHFLYMLFFSYNSSLSLCYVPYLLYQTRKQSSPGTWFFGCHWNISKIKMFLFHAEVLRKWTYEHQLREIMWTGNRSRSLLKNIAQKTFWRVLSSFSFSVNPSNTLSHSKDSQKLLSCQHQQISSSRPPHCLSSHQYSTGNTDCPGIL